MISIPFQRNLGGNTYLKPSSSLWRRLQGIRVATVGIITSGSGVGGAITLSTWLNPNECILEAVAGIGGWADTEACTDQIAPVSPCILCCWLDTIASWSNQPVIIELKNELDLQVSVMKWAGYPTSTSRGAKALM
jgi:hypothetical protein